MRESSTAGITTRVSRVDLFVFLVLILPTDYDSITRVESAGNLGQLRTLQSHRDVAYVNVIAAIENVDCLLLRVQHQRLNGNRHDVGSVRQLQNGIGVHPWRNGEILVLDIYRS